jgi:uncharacterized protein (TIGR02466 family)
MSQTSSARKQPELSGNEEKSVSGDASNDASKSKPKSMSKSVPKQKAKSKPSSQSKKNSLKGFKFKQNEYFPTLVFSIDVNNPEAMNEKLLDAIYADRARDKGIFRSNVKELGGWHSEINLHRMKEYKAIVAQINAATRRISKKLKYDEDYALRIGSMWSIINPRGSMNIAHVHPGCMWSGVYYVQTPEKAGNIEFIDPRTVYLMNQAKHMQGEKRPRETWSKVNFTPVTGRMIIFPSWLYHSVRPNATTESGDKANRVIISFNINQKKISRKSGS